MTPHTNTPTGSRNKLTWPVMVALGFLTIALDVHAVDGFYDTRFGSGGVRLVDVTPGPSDMGIRLILQPDGKLLMGGTCRKVESSTGGPFLAPKFCATRLRPDGSYDTSFGPGGVGYVSFDRFAGWDTNTFLLDMLRLKDGRIVFVGVPTDGTAMILAVLRADGATLDTSVGAGRGFIIFQFNGARSGARKMLQQADGKVLLAGNAIGPNGNIDMAVARFLPDFSGFDPAFGNGGYQVIGFDLGGPSGDNTDLLSDAALQADGKIILVGASLLNAAGSTEIPAPTLVRLLANGQPDPSFGPNQDGRIRLSPTRSYLSSVVIDGRGRLVIGGGVVAYPATTYLEWSVNRLMPDGSQDPGFNGGNLQRFLIRPGFTGGDQAIEALALQSDGKILAVGPVSRDGDGSQLYWGVARLLGNGTLDPAFGSSGRSYGTFGPTYTDSAPSIAIGNGGIMVGGYGQKNGSSRVSGKDRVDRHKERVRAAGSG